MLRVLLLLYLLAYSMSSSTNHIFDTQDGVNFSKRFNSVNCYLKIDDN